MQSSAQNKVVWSYGIEPGAAQRMNPVNRMWKEVAPTIREHMGDNQVAVAYGIDLYNQSMTGGGVENFE